MFISPDFGNRDVPALSLGKDFYQGLEYPEGFFITGEFYLILKSCFDPVIENVNVYIIHFNKEKCALERRVLIANQDISTGAQIGSNYLVSHTN